MIKSLAFIMVLELGIHKLSKIYNKKKHALNNFELTLKPGVLGLLGPNGAGKSTLMRIIATISKPTSGYITWNGINLIQNPNEIRKVLGYLPQSFGVYPHLNAVEFLEYIAGLKGIPKNLAKNRINELLEYLNLINVRRMKLGSFSGGMKQRIGIAQALLNDPQLLIVDEPTVGLDPEERVKFRQLIADIAEDRIVILSTHIVSDVEASASQIAIINEGNLIINEPPEKLLQNASGKVWKIVVPSEDMISARNQYQISGTLRTKEGMQLRVISDSAPSNDAKKCESTLEDAYLYHIAKDRSINSTDQKRG
jgi:ABC-type multidrug transport system ATPase subunit